MTPSNTAHPEGEVELLPCPFCGGRKLRNVTDDGPAWTKCETCEATGPTTFKYQEDGPDWNTRAFSIAEREGLEREVGQWKINADYRMREAIDALARAEAAESKLSALEAVCRRAYFEGVAEGRYPSGEGRKPDDVWKQTEAFDALRALLPTVPVERS